MTFDALHNADALPKDKHPEWYVGWHRALEAAARAVEVDRAIDRHAVADLKAQFHRRADACAAAPSLAAYEALVGDVLDAI